MTPGMLHLSLFIHFTVNTVSLFLSLPFFVCATFFMCLLYIPWGQECLIIVFPSISLFPSEATLCDPHDKITFVSALLLRLAVCHICLLSFVLLDYFSHRQKSGEIPLHFCPRCVSSISLSARPPTVHEWMGMSKVSY